ncbi:MAG: DsrE family protein [Gammaproteobacteria bacterium]|nr:DsrE family protein [Gammaproteobacteria bacterium]
MKTAIIILSDPATRSEDALGRLFNGLAAAYDFKTKQMDVTVLFQGTGTRWIKEIERTGHPAHALYMSIRDKVAGAAAGCAAFWHATDAIEQAGLALIDDNAVPGTLGLPSLAQLTADGYRVITF